MIKAIFFDLDGTLLDTLEDLGDAMNRVLENHGYPTHEISRYRIFVGDGMPNLVRRALPQGENFDENTVQSMVQEMKESFQHHWKNKSRLYPGIKELLTTLEEEGYLLGILTNKPQEFALTTVEYFLSDWDFKAVQGYDPEVYPLKPDPTALLSLMKQWNLKKEEVLYVGDSDVDMEVAKNAGVKSIGVSWGFRGAAELRDSGADFVVDRPEEILKIARKAL
ncbi:HAD family hydrolase [Isachenkonia alkalipeptolytica]|uniref:HAD family hydrolase n=1 Tax=Isachenkonia alkalipeptolytica TaxID=2565777 RepID=A0AA43XH95_9CLOT|nr:HAD family hydrolase [Isachenkonia alkalipeptolytica]NBG86905.1 HAD family hydrolase [Isachenkonia alkalipeptolytica]